MLHKIFQFTLLIIFITIAIISILVAKYVPQPLGGSCLFILFLCLVFFVLLYNTFLPKGGWWIKLEELESKESEAINEWRKADKFCKIIGKHEAIKLWEKQLEDEKNSTSDNIV